jgi:hypothetical protein
MKLFVKCIACLLVLSVMGLYCPNASFCAGSGLFAKTDSKTITRHEPKIMSEAEKDIPVTAAAKAGAKKKTPWLWVGLGAVALVAVVAMAGAGGGSDSKPPPPDKEGTITIGW